MKPPLELTIATLLVDQSPCTPLITKSYLYDLENGFKEGKTEKLLGQKVG